MNKFFKNHKKYIDCFHSNHVKRSGYCTSNEIRSSFLKFFKDNDHSVIKSSSLIPEDSTLLFTNSGMVQFKKNFLNAEDVDKSNKNLCSIQKCMRAGGKHNDLENVGFTARHHTLFEMMGNFSFGGYWKEQAINMAFIFLTKQLKLEKER